MSDHDNRVRREVYTTALARGTLPRLSDLATNCAMSVDDVRDAVRRLAAARILVLQPESGEILMAPPFSAVPTPFLVATSRYAAYANCAWDAIGIPIMLGEPAMIRSSCACCGEAVQLEVSPETSPLGDYVVHFAIPAKRWWDDLAFT